MTLQEHIDAIKATISDRMKKMSAIMTKAAKDNGSTPEGEDEKTVQGLEVEIKNLEANLARLEKIQKSQNWKMIWDFLFLIVGLIIQH